MAKLLGNLKLWQKILAIIGAFVLPFSVLAYFMFHLYHEFIQFALLERQGIVLIRPLATLLGQVQAHELQVHDKADERVLSTLRDGIERSIASMKGAEAAATDLKRKDGSEWAAVIRQKWNVLRERSKTLDPAENEKLHAELASEIRNVIAVVGDQSKLVLDPNLDSYYLMDIGVFVMPKLQERIGRMTMGGVTFFSTSTEMPQPQSKTAKMWSMAAIIQDNDLPRMETAVSRTLAEDMHFAGVTGTMDANITPAFDALKRDLLDLCAKTEQLGANMKRENWIATGTKASESASELWQNTLKELDAQIALRQKDFTTQRLRAILLTSVGLVISSLLAATIIRGLTRRLSRLTHAAELAATEGDLSTVIPPDDSDDEVAQLTAAFAHMVMQLRGVTAVAERLAGGDIAVTVEPLSPRDAMGNALASMVKNMAEMAHLAHQVAAGDLRVEPHPHSEKDVMGNALVKMIASLGALTRHVQRAAIIMNASVTDIAATSKEQQATTSEVAATTTEIGATSKEIYATSKELLKTVNEVSDVTDETATLANSGQTSLAKMEDTMRLFIEAVGSINSKLAVLNEKAANINQVVTTITKVADQTNLLSLNAAIEAEKAGEYGRGFAVVATEIRRLADQTALASYDIEKMVKDMQSAVAAGVMGMDKFGEQVRRGVGEVHQVSSQLAQIIQHVQALAPRVGAVNEGMEAQATAADQITEALSQLVDATQQTADSLRQSNLSIEKLHGASRGMLVSLEGFKLREP